MTADLIAEGRKMLDGVTAPVWNADGSRIEAFRGKDADGADYWEAVSECENEQDARFIAWTREGVPALLARLEVAEALVGDCGPYLKEGETPRKRMDRDHADVLGLMKLLELEKRKVEAAEAKLARMPEVQALVAEAVAKEREQVVNIVQQSAKDARDVFSDATQAKDAVNYMEQLIYAAIRAGKGE